MKRPGITRGGIVGGMTFLLLMGLAAGARAQAPFPSFARGYIAYMGRAMDECTVPTLTVSAPANLPSDGCPQTNVTTDDQASMGFARVYLRQTGKIIVVGGGFLNPQNVKLEMTLRVTRQAVNTNMGPQTVTFPDLTVQCPTIITSQPDGSVYNQTLTLASCLGLNSGLASGVSNIQVVGVALLNADNGDEVFGRPGIVR